jgi:hypothetical protein
MNRPLVPRLHLLEDRCNPAGTVTASFDAAGNYVVVGDGEANELRFEGGTLVGENGTTVNGPATGIDTSGRVTFRLRGGDDRLTIAGGMNIGRGLRVDLGTGSNALEVTGAGYTITGAFDILQAGDANQFRTTTVRLAPQAGDTIAVLGPISYTSTGRVDDTVEFGFGGNVFAQGALTTRLGAGTNNADLRLTAAAGVTVADQSVPGTTYNVSLAIPSVQGDVVATLGAGGGFFQATHTNGVTGRFAATNNPASQSTVGVTATVGEVGESFTVRTRTVTQFVTANFARVGGDLSVTGGGSQFTSITLNGGNVGGSTTVTTNQSTAPNPAPNLSRVTLSASTIGGGVAVTNTGPETVTTTVDVSAVAQDLRVIARGPEGTATIRALGVGGDADVSVNGHDAEVSLGNLAGSARVAVADSTATVQDASVGGNLTLIAAGASTNLVVEDVTVAGNLTSRATGRDVINTISGGGVTGLATFTGGTQSAGSFRVQLDDLSLGGLTYTGGAGRNFLDLDTRAGLAGQVVVTGRTRAVLGGGDDEVTFGGLTADLPPVPDPTRHVEFRDDVFVNGGGGTDALFNRNATLVPPAELTTVNIEG